jgi:hypothetical protein
MINVGVGVGVGECSIVAVSVAVGERVIVDKSTDDGVSVGWIPSVG